MNSSPFHLGHFVLPLSLFLFIFLPGSLHPSPPSISFLHQRHHSSMVVVLRAFKPLMIAPWHHRLLQFPLASSSYAPRRKNGVSSSSGRQIKLRFFMCDPKESFHLSLPLLAHLSFVQVWFAEFIKRVTILKFLLAWARKWGSLHNPLHELSSLEFGYVVCGGRSYWFLWFGREFEVFYSWVFGLMCGDGVRSVKVIHVWCIWGRLVNRSAVRCIEEAWWSFLGLRWVDFMSLLSRTSRFVVNRSWIHIGQFSHKVGEWSTNFGTWCLAKHLWLWVMIWSNGRLLCWGFG